MRTTPPVPASELQCQSPNGRPEEPPVLQEAIPRAILNEWSLSPPALPGILQTDDEARAPERTLTSTFASKSTSRDTKKPNNLLAYHHVHDRSRLFVHVRKHALISRHWRAVPHARPVDGQHVVRQGVLVARRRVVVHVLQCLVFDRWPVRRRRRRCQRWRRDLRGRWADGLLRPGVVLGGLDAAQELVRRLDAGEDLDGVVQWEHNELVGVSQIQA
jgi:hypothetical protein